MDYIKLSVKGFFVGIALIIPGLSGGTLAIYLGIYEKLLHSIGNIFTEFKKSIQFLIPLFIGIAISIIALAKLLGYLIDINSFVVLFFFMGLLVGGTKDIYREASPEGETPSISSMISGVTSFMLVILLIVFGKLGSTTGIATIEITLANILLLVLLGMAASMTMIVPGVSGSALLIVLGYYTAIVTNVIGNVLDFSQLWYHVQVLVPFAIGAAIGIILFSKVIEYALQQYRKQTYFAILGFILGSVIAIFFEIKNPATGTTHDLQTAIYSDLGNYLAYNLLSVFGGILLFIVGFIIARRLSQLEQ